MIVCRTVDNIFFQKQISGRCLVNLRMKYTQATIDKLERTLEESGYVLRYERGTFQSGYCILEQKKVVVLNKYLQLEGRINTLIDLIPQLQVSIETLSPESLKLYEEVVAKQAEGKI